jgi:hypothetical protein
LIAITIYALQTVRYDPPQLIRVVTMMVVCVRFPVSPCQVTASEVTTMLFSLKNISGPFLGTLIDFGHTGDTRVGSQNFCKPVQVDLNPRQ